MKPTFLIASLILFNALNSVAAPAPSTSTASGSADEYNVGNELMKQILASIQKDKFNLYLNFDINVFPESEAPPQINVFEMQAVMAFKHNPEGISVPLMAENPKAKKQEKKLMLRTHLNLSNRYAVIRLLKGDGINEFVGDVSFYVKGRSTGKLVADEVEFDLNSELLDIKSLYIKGARLRVQLPGPKASKEQIKRGLVQALLECNAETDVVDPINQTLTQEPLQKCVFDFDGERLRLQYREPKPSYLP